MLPNMRLFLEFRQPDVWINRYVLAPYAPFHDWNEHIFKASTQIPMGQLTTWKPLDPWYYRLGTIQTYDPGGDVCERHVRVFLPMIGLRKPIEGEKKTGKPPLTLLPGSEYGIVTLFAPCELMVGDGPETHDPLRGRHPAQA